VEPVDEIWKKKVGSFAGRQTVSGADFLPGCCLSQQADIGPELLSDGLPDVATVSGFGP